MSKPSATLPKHDGCAPGDAIDRAARPPVLFEVTDDAMRRVDGRMFDCFLEAKHALDRATRDVARYVRCTRCACVLARRVPPGPATRASFSLPRLVKT